MSMTERIMRHFGFSRTPEVRVIEKVVPRGTIGGLTQMEWVSHADNVHETRAFLNGRLGVSLLSILQNHIPRGFPRQGGPITETQAAVEYGRVQGYLYAIELLNSCAEHPPKQPEEVPADYGAEQILNPDPANLYAND